MSSENSEGIWTASNAFLVLSNLAFMFPFVACVKFGRPIQAALFLYMTLASSLYHVCKWGVKSREGPGGWCPQGLTFEFAYDLDFFGTQMMIPAILSFLLNPKYPLAWFDGGRNNRRSSPTVSIMEEEYLGPEGLRPSEGELLLEMSPRSHDNSITYGYGKRYPERKKRIVKKYSEWFWVMADGLYLKSGRGERVRMALLEALYLIFHVWFLVWAIMVLGTSMWYVTVPLILWNVLFVPLLMISTWKAPFKGKRVKVEVNNVTREPSLDTVLITYEDQIHAGDLGWAYSKARSGLGEFFRVISAGWGKTDLIESLCRRPTWENVKGEWLEIRTKVARLSYSSANRGPLIALYPLETNRTRMKFFVLALALVCVGLTIFFTQHLQAPIDYYWAHSLWHILEGIGFYLMIEKVF